MSPGGETDSAENRPIAVLDYGIGNLGSVAKALSAIGAPARLVTRAADPSDFSGVVLPGVGAFGACARELRRYGFDEVVMAALAGGIPLLGVCVGLQLLFEGSEESPEAEGLGVLGGVIRRFDCDLPIPQMQWNRLRLTTVGERSPLFEGLGPQPWMYFVHSYAAPLVAETSAAADYCGEFTAAIERGNLFATQFHPEKSSGLGLAMLSNFARIAAEKG